MEQVRGFGKYVGVITHAANGGVFCSIDIRVCSELFFYFGFPSNLWHVNSVKKQKYYYDKNNSSATNLHTEIISELVIRSDFSIGLAC